jgi:hypothetical protein
VMNRSYNMGKAGLDWGPVLGPHESRDPSKFHVWPARNE